ncbi:MAG: hypothetical protein ACRC5T_05090 [Cetobacterium sp.]
MASKGQKQLSKSLNSICKSFGVILFEELAIGNKRYDFYIPLYPPVCIEFDGVQHDDVVAGSFFFKTADSLQKYKENDFERNRLHKLGSIRLYRFRDNDLPNTVELLDIFEEDGILEEMREGVDEENAYVRKKRRDEESSERRKTKNREFRENIKKRNSSGS